MMASYATFKKRLKIIHRIIFLAFSSGTTATSIQFYKLESLCTFIIKTAML